FIRPYRVRSDIQTWFNDPAIFELIKSEYARGGYVGIGEFHIYGKAAGSDWVKQVVDSPWRGTSICMRFATKRHCSSFSVTIPRPASSGRIPVFWYRPRALGSCSVNTKMRCGASYPIGVALPAATAS